MKKFNAFTYDKHQLILSKIVREFCLEMKNIYGLKFEGIGKEVFGNRHKFFLTNFSSKKAFTKKEGKEILMDAAFKFLEKINSSHEFKDFAYVFPFSLDNLSIIINHDTNSIRLIKGVYSSDNSTPLSRTLLTYSNSA